MKKIIPFVAYLLSVFVSHRFVTGYWVVGLVFAAAVFAVHYEKVFKKFSVRHWGFAIASTLIYALVYWMADKGWKFRNDWLDMLAGSLTGGVVVGSFLMPSVHAVIFGIDFKTVRSTFLWLVASWYFALFFSWLWQTSGLKPNLDFSLFAIALWQGIYLKRLQVS